MNMLDDFQKSVVLFGAGSIGKGLLAQLAGEANMRVVFADVNPYTITALRGQHSYPVRILQSQGETIERISNYSALHSNDGKDQEVLVDEIARADLVMTAVGEMNLRAIAPFIAAGIARRLAHTEGARDPFVVLACENVRGNSATLERFVCQAMGVGTQENIRRAARFPRCVVDRLVPEEQKDESLLSVTVQEYSLLQVHKEALGDAPFSLKGLPGVEVVEDIDAAFDKKFYLFNTAHCAAAAFGARAGHRYIHEALEVRGIRGAVVAVLEESSEFLFSLYPEAFTLDELQAASRLAVERMSEPRLFDTVSRVLRNPARKLGPEERLLRPARALAVQRRPTRFLVEAIAALLSYRSDEDPQAGELQTMVGEYGIEKALTEVCGLVPTDPLFPMIREVAGGGR